MYSLSPQHLSSLDALTAHANPRPALSCTAGSDGGGPDGVARGSRVVTGVPEGACTEVWSCGPAQPATTAAATTSRAAPNTAGHVAMSRMIDIRSDRRDGFPTESIDGGDRRYCSRTAASRGWERPQATPITLARHPGASRGTIVEPRAVALGVQAVSRSRWRLAAGGGIEPPSRDPKSPVLPLHHPAPLRIQSRQPAPPGDSLIGEGGTLELPSHCAWEASP